MRYNLAIDHTAFIVMGQEASTINGTPPSIVTHLPVAMSASFPNYRLTSFYFCSK